MTNNINPPERSRIYHWHNGSKLEVKLVSDVQVTKSGYHKLTTEGGMHYLVAPGWLYIELDIDDWSI